MGVVIVSTSSAGHDNINRMACVNVRDFGLLPQNLVTYEAVKHVAFVMIFIYMPNYCRVCSRISPSCDILCITMDALIYISSNSNTFLESYSALRLDEEDSRG